MKLDYVSPDDHVVNVVDYADRELRELLEARPDVEVIVWARFAAILDRGALTIMLPGGPPTDALERMRTSDRVNLADRLRELAARVDPR